MDITRAIIFIAAVIFLGKTITIFGTKTCADRKKKSRGETTTTTTIGTKNIKKKKNRRKRQHVELKSIGMSVIRQSAIDGLEFEWKTNIGHRKKIGTWKIS